MSGTPVAFFLFVCLREREHTYAKGRDGERRDKQAPSMEPDMGFNVGFHLGW